VWIDKGKRHEPWSRQAPQHLVGVFGAALTPVDHTYRSLISKTTGTRRTAYF